MMKHENKTVTIACFGKKRKSEEYKLQKLHYFKKFESGQKINWVINQKITVTFSTISQHFITELSTSFIF